MGSLGLIDAKTLWPWLGSRPPKPSGTTLSNKALLNFSIFCLGFLLAELGKDRQESSLV